MNINYLRVKNNLKTAWKIFSTFNLKESKADFMVFSFTFLQSEDIKVLKNNALIIFEKIGEGIHPGADSIRALRPDFQVPFLTSDFFVQSSNLLNGIICSKHGAVQGELVQMDTDRSCKTISGCYCNRMNRIIIVCLHYGLRGYAGRMPPMRCSDG